MAQDIQKGRRTEIGELNAFVGQKAEEAACAAPTMSEL